MTMAGLACRPAGLRRLGRAMRGAALPGASLVGVAAGRVLFFSGSGNNTVRVADPTFGNVADGTAQMRQALTFYPFPRTP